jgi:oligopeptide/dipeptide ABC transporter ATP-binding protein
MLFVSHDIGVVAKVSDRIAVMYLGRIVEQGPTAEILKRPRHPYTQALLAAAPAMHPALRRSRRPLEGDPPSPSRPPPGCHFHTRCPIAEARCKVEQPLLRDARADVAVACHLAMSASAPQAQIKSFDAASRA